MHKNAHARKLSDVAREINAYLHTHHRQTHSHTPHTHHAHMQTLNYGQSWATVAWFIADGAGTQLLTFAQVVKLKAQESQYTAIYV